MYRICSNTWFHYFFYPHLFNNNHILMKQFTALCTHTLKRLQAHLSGHIMWQLMFFSLGVTDAKCSLSTVPGSSAGTAMTLTSVKIALKLANTTPDIRLAE